MLNNKNIYENPERTDRKAYRPSATAVMKAHVSGSESPGMKKAKAPPPRRKAALYVECRYFSLFISAFTSAVTSLLSVSLM